MHPTAAKWAETSSERKFFYRHHEADRGPVVGPGDYLVRLPTSAHAGEIFRLLAELEP